MYFVYAIKSQKDGRIYVGLSSNIQKRVTEHLLNIMLDMFFPLKVLDLGN